MREIGKIFRTYYSESHSSWALYLSLVQNCLNLLVHQSTNCVPWELHFGKKAHEKIWEIFPLLQPPPREHQVLIQIANEQLSKAFKQRLNGQKSVSKILLS